MELAIARVGAILGPLVAGLLQQTYQSPTAMFVSIGLAAMAAGSIILLAERPPVEQALAARQQTTPSRAAGPVERKATA
jgi:AAHS family 4-hydroxybenzoate transporter-like MFS transporter